MVNGQWSMVSFAFFGTDEFSIIVLNELKKADFVPALVVTVPDRPKGRGLKLTPPPAKLWAEENNIPFLQPENLSPSKFKIPNSKFDVFIVAAYGKILPKTILDIPRCGVLNVHPSLLPLYRGPSPIEAQILDSAPEVGVSIMKIDEKM